MGETIDATADTVPPSETAGQTRHFELISEKSSKFWEITLSGTEHTVRFGRLGTQGQKKTKTFIHAIDAQRDYERLIRSKQGKGYRET